MKLTISIILATLAIAAAAASSATAGTTTRGYTCKYSVSFATLVLDGNDNAPIFCRELGGSGGLKRFYGTTRGTLACRFESPIADVRVSIYAKSRIIGLAYCRVIGKVVRGQFVRTR